MDPEASIVIVSGPPASGKTSVSLALAALFPRSLRIPVDDLREWVVSGISQPVPEWTEETERQFALAEDAAADVAVRYLGGGFTVVLDHCRRPENIDAWAARSFGGRHVHKVALLPHLSTCLKRNRSRSDKSFDPDVLEPVIRTVRDAYDQADLRDWLVHPNLGTVESTALELFQALCDA
ncbi:MAG: AAA family ATPase [Armatimonadetes bacterium]|nr:AAA family ATPase [Armatimonadota bacterium]